MPRGFSNDKGAAAVRTIDGHSVFAEPEDRGDGVMVPSRRNLHTPGDGDLYDTGENGDGDGTVFP